MYTNAIYFTLLTYALALKTRLPDTITPTFYQLSLNIDPSSDSYSGTANITLVTTTATDQIYIHQDGDFLVIGSSPLSIILNNNAKCTAESPSTADIVIITCSRSLLLNQDNSLYIEFSGKFSTEDGYGLVKTTYMDGDTERVMVESNFKPTYARRVFPCMDEPEFKAGFSIVVHHPSDYTVLSNSPAVSSVQSVRDNLQITKFEDTPAISTYLVSIFLSNLKQADTLSEDDVDFKIYTRSEVTNSVKTIANNYFHKIIEKLDNYTGVPYESLNDTESYLVALPDYTDTMGGFGLFTFSETDLLDEGDKTPHKVKQNIITTMAYKLSHEWYGGNVATQWWSDVWANEAVATYLKYVIADEVEEELELTQQFLLEETQRILQSDAYSFAQSLSSKESDIVDDWEIENKLRSANYEKGANILHMSKILLRGKENFKLALQDHLQKRNDSDTNGTNIIQDLLSGKGEYDYVAMLEKWIYSPGFPLVTMKMKNEENDTLAAVASITQKRFLYPTEDKSEQSSDWIVPLISSTLNNQHTDDDIRVDVVLQPGDDMMYIFSFETEWILLNTQGSFFYRVNYDEELWGKLLYALNSDRTVFPVLQRAQFVDDIFSIARIGDVNYSLAFEVADSLVNETEYYPWYSALKAFSYLVGKMETEEIELSLKNYVLNLMEHLVAIPTENFVEATDSHVDVLKTVLVLEWACKLGHAGCTTYASKSFDSYKKSKSLDDLNARGIILCNGIRHSTNLEDDYNLLWGEYTKATANVHEQNDILNAIGCAEDQELLQTYLNKLTTEDSGIKHEDAVIVFKSVLSSSVGLEAAMEFLENNLSNIYNFYYDMEILAEMIYAVAENLITDDHITWLETLLEDGTLGNYKDVKVKATTLAKVNNYWQKHFRKQVTDIFSSTSSSTESTAKTSSNPETTSSNPTSNNPTSNNPTISTEPTTTPHSKSEVVAISNYCFFLFVIVITLLN